MIKKVKLKTFCEFIIILIFFVIRYMQTLFELNKTFLYIYISALLFITILVLFKRKYTKKSLLNITFISSIIMMITFFTGKSDFLVPLFFSIIFSENDENEILKNILISSSIMFTIAILLNCFGITINKTIYRYTANESIARNTLGFPSANSAFIHFIAVPLLMYCITNKKKNIFILFIIGLYIYIKTNCRTGFIVFSFFTFTTFFLSPKCIKRMNKILPYAFPLFFSISYFFAIQYKNLSWLDNLLSNRLSFWNLSLNTYKISLFANSEIIYPIDNLFLGLLLKYGLLSLLLYGFLYISNYKYIKSEKIKYILLIYLIYGLFECNLDFYMNCSIFILLLFNFKSTLIKKGEKNNEDIIYT